MCSWCIPDSDQPPGHSSFCCAMSTKVWLLKLQMAFRGVVCLRRQCAAASVPWQAVVGDRCGPDSPADRVQPVRFSPVSLSRLRRVVTLLRGRKPLVLHDTLLCCAVLCHYCAWPAEAELCLNRPSRACTYDWLNIISIANTFANAPAHIVF